MKPNVLVTCPDYDRMTRYLSGWAETLMNEVQAHGNEVYMLKSSEVTRSKFESFVKKMKPAFIFINGHGAADKIAGHDHGIILDKDNVGILKGTTIYALSCQSANELGPMAIQAGAKGYVGYTEDFYLVSQPAKTAHPTEDTTAALFLEPSNVIANALSKGHDAHQAVEKGRAAYTKSILQAFNSDVQSDDDKYVPYLLWNRKYLTAC
jgi:hypothetical protein